MVAASGIVVRLSELDHPRRGADGPELARAKRGMIAASRQRTSPLRPGFRVRNQAVRTAHGQKDVRDTVRAALVSLADIVKEGRGDEVRVLVPAREKPPRRGGAVDDVTRMLRREERDERRRQACPRDDKVALGG